MQGGTFVRPSGQTAVPRSADQVGGPDTRGRGQRHGQHSAHAGHAGLRPDRQPAHVRRAGGGSRGRRTEGAAETAAGRAARATAVRHERQRGRETANDPRRREEKEEVIVVADSPSVFGSSVELVSVRTRTLCTVSSNKFPF